MIRQSLISLVVACWVLPASAGPAAEGNHASGPSDAERSYVVGSSLGLLEGFAGQCPHSTSVEIPLLTRFKAEAQALAAKPNSQLLPVIEAGRQQGKASAESFVRTANKAEFCAQFLAKAPLMTETDVERAIALTKRSEFYQTGEAAESFAMGYAHATLVYAEATCELSTANKEVIPKLRQPYWDALSAAQRKAFSEGEAMGRQLIETETAGKPVADNCTGMDAFVKTAVSLFRGVKPR